MLTQEKVFPERLPKDFHGPIKPFRRTRQTLDHIDTRDLKLQKQSIRLNAWKRRKPDREIQQINRVMVSNPVRSSFENPQWLKSTFVYQQRALQHRKQKDHKHYNILGYEKGEERTDFRRSNVKLYSAVFPIFEKTPLKFDWPVNQASDRFAVTSKVGFHPNSYTQTERRMTRSHYECSKEVTPKIGSTTNREHSMRRTVMKIGHDRVIDTNSVL